MNLNGFFFNWMDHIGPSVLGYRDEVLPAYTSFTMGAIVKDPVINQWINQPVFSEKYTPKV